MSLEAAIHARCASGAALVALVPAERIVTGAARGDMTLPYVVVTRERETVRTRTSSQLEVSETTVRFEIRAADLDQAKSIAEAVRERFNRQGFALPAGTCLVMQWSHETEQAAAGGRLRGARGDGPAGMSAHSSMKRSKRWRIR